MISYDGHIRVLPALSLTYAIDISRNFSIPPFRSSNSSFQFAFHSSFQFAFQFPLETPAAAVASPAAQPEAADPFGLLAPAAPAPAPSQVSDPFGLGMDAAAAPSLLSPAVGGAPAAATTTVAAPDPFSMFDNAAAPSVPPPSQAAIDPFAAFGATPSPPAPAEVAALQADIARLASELEAQTGEATHRGDIIADLERKLDDSTAEVVRLTAALEAASEVTFLP